MAVSNHAERTSPCLRVCLVDARTEFCRGCGRTLAEIANWAGFTDEQREAVLADLPKRSGTGGE